MRYWTFPTAPAAEKAQRIILLLWSHALAGKGYGKGTDGVVNTGQKRGKLVPATTERWSPVWEVVGGWAIRSPDGYTFEDGTPFDLVMAQSFKAADMAKIGIRNRTKPLASVGPFTETDTIKRPPHVSDPEFEPGIVWPS